GFLALVSFPLLFIADGVTSLLAAAVLSTLLWLRRGAPRETAPAVSAEGDSGERPLLSTESVVWQDRAPLLFFPTSFLVNLIFVQHEGAMPLYIVRDLHYRESFYGMLFVINTLIIVAIEVPLNIAMAHWPVRRALPLAVMLIAVGFGALSVARTPLAIAG